VLIALTAFAGLCQLQTLGRADIAHLAAASTPALILLAPFLHPLRRRSSILAAACAAPILAVGVLGLSVADFRGVPREGDLLRAVQTIDSATQRQDPIFVGLTGNRYTYINPLMAYYLADRVPGTRWTMYNPGITNRLETQTDMVTSLERSRVPILLLDDSMAEAFEPHNDSRIPGSTVLDEFIASRYSLVCSFGDLRVMALAGSGEASMSCPTSGGRP
jgi:hypothetical protein